MLTLTCYAGGVKEYSGHERSPRRRGPPADPVTELRAYAVKLHDKGDGHGVDWAKVAEMALRVGFSCLRELPTDESRPAIYLCT
jgi:hypothetical protein